MGRLPKLPIPVLVTGIQRAQVFGRRRLLWWVIHRADARWLDPCDNKHRDDGGEGARGSVDKVSRIFLKNERGPDEPGPPNSMLR
ncbi:hypothetical protein GGE45_006224 [Rhizobium aethiopicum]|uniref:Uncharacterized protein n=1 Tax=Rhizobium aethiopicum TaxID=1138170 RepID=A0A7W6QEI1_9HYPH|nr:hypothetical protein [Rhizobium aethiopicum]MBB4583842.1 hypothetical protein [Rhizobium aethiopicum]